MTLYYIFLTLLIITILFELIALIMLIRGKAKTKVPFLPVPEKMLPYIYEELHLSPDAILYDLGCGDSRALRYAMKRNKTIHTVGVEWADLPYYTAKFWNTFWPKKNLTLIHGDFFNVEIHNATHIFMYLLPKVMDALLPKLKQELKPGTRIVSCDFKFKDLVPIETKKYPLPRGYHTLYIYEI